MKLKFAAAEADQNQNSALESHWNVMVVDDETEVHNVTAMVLKKFRYKKQPLNIINAYSASEAIDILNQADNIALVLLDVVMEEDLSGFRVVDHIRDFLENRFTQIILRTGQAGTISEEQSMLSYEINGFKEKSDLSASHLISTTIASLRAYDLLQNMNDKIQECSHA